MELGSGEVNSFQLGVVRGWLGEADRVSSEDTSAAERVK